MALLELDEAAADLLVEPAGVRAASYRAPRGRSTDDRPGPSRPSCGRGRGSAGEPAGVSPDSYGGPDDLAGAAVGGVRWMRGRAGRRAARARAAAPRRSGTPGRRTAGGTG